MKKFIYIIILLAFSVPTLSKLSEADVPLVYSGFKFNIPKDHVAVGSTGGKDNFLVFKYNSQPVKNYIAFSKMIPEPNINYNCELDIFIKDAFLNNKDTKCNLTELNSFRKVFLNDKDKGIWKKNGLMLYYTVSKKDAFLFVIDTHGTVIKVDSDFIDKAGLKKIASDLLH
jgi:hypothetical protein